MNDTPGNGNDTPGNGLVVRTAWLAARNTWVWEIVDASSGRVRETSWPSHWARPEGRALAQQAGVARLSELVGSSSASTTSVVTSRSTGRSLLIVVPRSRVDLYQALKRSFADDERAEVVLDRRFRDRRVRSSRREGERRKAERRRRTDIDAKLSTGRSVTVPLVSRPANFRDPDARAFLLFCCNRHVVGCQKCHTTYRLGWLRLAEPGIFACPLCGFDITPAVAAHTETCPNWLDRVSGRRPTAPTTSAIG